jgi:cell division septation protein DedD
MRSRINWPALSYESTQKLVLLVVGLVSAVEIVILFWSANIIEIGSGVWIDRLQNIVSEEVRKLVNPQISYTNAGSKADNLGDEVQTDALPGVEILSPPFAGKTSLTTQANTDTNISSTVTSSDINTKSMQPAVDVKIHPRETNRDTGTWAINLVSFQREVDAERFVIKARSKGVATEINQATMNEKKYWRVQISGFSSSDEASKNASVVQHKLGLNDVWILQR